MAISNKKWEAEKRNMQSYYVALTTKSTNIIDIPMDMKEIAYTSSDGNIHISAENMYTKELASKEAVAFRLGLFYHELLHQVLSDISQHEAIRDKPLAIINNCLEDPAIEYFAPQIAGGVLYNSLLYVNDVLFHVSKEITSESAFEEFINALICFGQKGKIKGKFSSIEAEKIFIECLPILWNGIISPDPAARFELSKEIWKISKPLWENESQDSINELLQGMNEQKGGLSSIQNSGCEQCKDIKIIPEKNNPQTQIQVDQSNFIEILKEIAAKSQENNVNNAEGEEKETNGSNVAGDEEETIKELFREMLNQITQEGNDETQMPKSSKELQSQIDDAMEKEKSEQSKDSQNQKASGKIPNTRVREKKFEDILVVNKVMGYDQNDIGKYNSIVTTNNVTIKSLFNRLQSIIYNIDEEVEYKNSGRISIGRVYSGRPTSRVFTRVREPDRESDFEVVMLIDNSGSMGGEKIKVTIETAIVLTEVFNRLGIPIYSMGYQNQGKVCHYHFSSWDNVRNKYSLVNMHASGNNFDGYSIRYAKEILKSKRRNLNNLNRIFIIISDGAPNCNYYGGCRTERGIKDTKQAVDEMRKMANVIALGICDEKDTPVLHSIYGNDFILVRDLSDLKQKIIRKLIRIMEE